MITAKFGMTMLHIALFLFTAAIADAGSTPFSEDLYYKKVMKYEEASASDLNKLTEGELSIAIGENFFSKTKNTAPVYQIEIHTNKNEVIMLSANSDEAVKKLSSGMKVRLRKTNNKSMSFKIQLATTNPLAKSVSNFKIDTIEAPPLVNRQELQGDQNILFLRLRNYRPTSTEYYPTNFLTKKDFQGRLTNPSNPWSLQSIYDRASNNKLNIIPTVIDGLWGPSCLTGTTLTNVFKMAVDQIEDRQNPVDVTAFDRIVITLPENYNCSGFNWGTLGKYNYFFKYGNKKISVSWLYEWNNNTLFGKILAHEIGHNLYFNHAASISCSQSSILQNDCTKSEYGDQNDLMGSLNYDEYQYFSAFRRYFAGWLPPSNVKIINTDANANLDLYESNTISNNQTQLILIPITKYGFGPLITGRAGFIAVEYGSNSQPSNYQGVFVKYVSESGRTHNPTWISPLRSAGSSFVDTANNITITALNFSNNKVTIGITKNTTTGTTLEAYPGHIATGHGSGNCSEVIVDTNSQDVISVYLAENKTLTFNHIFGESIGTVNGKSRYFFNASEINPNLDYTVILYTATGVYTKQLDTWSCNQPRPTAKLSVRPNAQSAPCESAVANLDSINITSGSHVQVQASSSSTNEIISQCNTTIYNNNASCVLPLDPNGKYTINAKVDDLNGKTYPLPTTHLGSWHCPTTVKKDLIVLRNLKYGLADTCRSTSIDIASKNVTDGTNLEFIAMDENSNQFQCTKVLSKSYARCHFTGLLPNTQYYITTSIGDESVVESKKTDFCL